MQVFLNGESKEIAADMTLYDLAGQFCVVKNTYATAVNNQFVSRDQYEHHKLNDGD